MIDTEKYISIVKLSNKLNKHPIIIGKSIKKLELETIRYINEKYVLKKYFNKVKADIMRTKNGKDITGKKYNYLTAVKPTGKKKKWHGRNSYVWIWKCICGKKIELPVCIARQKQTCGCLINDKRVNITNKQIKTKFGIYKGTNISKLKSKTATLKSSTGIRGVYLGKYGNFVVYITVSGKTRYIGSFIDLEKARKARLKAEKIYFKPVIEKYEANYNIQKNKTKDKMLKSQGRRKKDN